VLAPDPDLPLLHTRGYDVRSFRISENALLLRGSVVDRKPPGWFIPEDLEPLDLHHIAVDLTLSFPEMVITAIDVQFEAFPQIYCDEIIPAYDALVGLSITRGFVKTVKEMFGGPRGCSHVGALLQAMAPVAIQSIWSMQVVNKQHDGRSATPMAATTAERIGPSRNTCHVWADEGPLIPRVLGGETVPVMLTVRRRLSELGVDQDEWYQRQQAASAETP
jgi:hypothetical protein